MFPIRMFLFLLVVVVVPLSLMADPCSIDKGTPVGMIDDKKLTEASGLAASRHQAGILWTHVDHGGDPAVYAISESGVRIMTAMLEDKVNQDMEDIAIYDVNGVSFIYLGDMGNSDFDRTVFTIYRFKEPSVSQAKGTDIDIVVDKNEIEALEFKYPGFAYDAEALTVDPQTGDIFIFTKDRENIISEVYRYPAPQSFLENPFTLEHVATLPCFWVTGGDISPDGSTLALTNKQEAYGWSLPAGLTWHEYLSLAPEPCILTMQEEEQREAIAVTDSGYWTTSECKNNPPCPLWFYKRN